MRRLVGVLKNDDGMEMVQVAILVGIAIFIGLIFKDQIGSFVNNVFGNLMGSGF